MVAAPFAGPTIDKVGRKNGLVIGNILMIIGALIQAFARNGRKEIWHLTHPKTIPMY